MKFRSRVVAGMAAALALGLCVAAGPALAECDIDNAIFDDDFEFMDDSWGEPNEWVYVEDGVLILKEYMGQVNFLTMNKTADVCADMTLLDATNIPYSPIGLVFWWQDWDNHYTVLIWADGGYEVRRMVNGNETIVTGGQSLAIKKGVGETNRVRLTLKPRDATLFINGTEIKRFKGKPPKDGGAIGFYGMSPAEEPARFAFDNFIVSELTE